MAVQSRYGLSIKGVTPDLEQSARGDRVDEILLWLEMRAAKSPVASWVAIDDMDLLRKNPRLKEANFVHTEDEKGLDREKMEEALRKLLA